MRVGPAGPVPVSGSSNSANSADWRCRSTIGLPWVEVTVCSAKLGIAVSGDATCVIVR